MSASNPGRSETLTASLEEVALRDDFNSADAWHAQPGWLSNASPAAGVTVADGIACFSVPEAGRGMKWSRATPEVSLEDVPYLVIRYRAENLRAQGDDYFIYLDDGGPAQCSALRLRDIVSDGQWHTVAVNARRLAAKPEIKAVAIHVAAGSAGNARLWMDWLMFADRVPEDATELRAAPRSPAAPDWTAPLASSKWTAQPSWLSDPCAKPETIRGGEATVFRVNEPGRGMKWSWTLPGSVPLAGHCYLTMHYRATNSRPVGDYAVCVLGKSRDGGSSYLSVVASREIVSDGRWRTVAADLGPALERFVDINGIAIQLRASAETPAELRVDRLALTSQRLPKNLSEFVSVGTEASLAGLEPINMAGLFNQDSAKLCRRLDIGDALPSGKLTVEGIPFELPNAKPDLFCSTLAGEESLAIPVKARAGEVYLLAWAVFAGGEEPSRGARKLRRIADVDRFRVELDYADGSRTECLPFNVGTRRFEVGEGPQVLCAWADRSKELRRVIVRDHTPQGAFGVAAVTCRTAGERLHPECAEDTPPLRIERPTPAPVPGVRPTVRVEQKRLTLSNNRFVLAVEFAPVPRVVGWVNRATGHDCLAGRASGPLLAIPRAELKLACQPTVTKSPERVTVELRYGVSSSPGVEAVIGIEIGDGPEIAFDVALDNKGAQPATLGFAGPNLGEFCLGRDLDRNCYLLPKCGAAFHHAPASYKERYCGHDMPLQFVSVVNPDDGEGLYLRTEDTTDIWRNYNLSKDDKGVTVGIDYPDEPLAAGATRHGVRAVFGVSGGDWRDGFEAYRRWLQSWYRPVAPRQSWFREAFNFRQRFLWGNDPLCDHKTGELHLERALTEAQEKFGGIEYLHLFDWGNCGKFGRIYGRTGDYSAYDYIPGGKEAFRKAIAGVQAQGVPVGLYIEGYLLEEHGKLGGSRGREWQLIGRDGKPLYWPKSTEMFICSWVSAWRDVQAGTYAARVGELDVNGMYVDKFGFANAAKDCFSREHGHPVPGYAVAGERDCMKAIRDRVDGVKRGVVLYGEECPCDVNTQNQDGSFTYSMATAARTQTLAPLNLLRFAIPSFKTFEILVCDKPTGSWATGVKWVFFNGEGLWLERPADDWFAPETLATIRKCHALLREHKDAFTSDAPVPLAPTMVGGVFANLFPTEGKRVYTLYNSRHRTFSGEVLRLPHLPGARYRDAWNDCELAPRLTGADDILSTTIAPQGVGCIVVTAPPAR